MALKSGKSKVVDRIPGGAVEFETLDIGLDSFSLKIKRSKEISEIEDWSGLDLNRLLYEMSVEADSEIIAPPVFGKTAGCAFAFIGLSSFIVKFSFLIIGI